MKKCFGCQREIEVGDRYIEDTATGFIGRETDPAIDGLISEMFGNTTGKVAFCDGCTAEGGEYRFETYYGDNDDA